MPSPRLFIESLLPRDHKAIASLLHLSLVQWYESRLRQGSRFGDSADPFGLIPEVYEELDPGEALVARDENGGQFLGVCFVHPRPTHVSVGIVATAPEAQGRGVAKALLEPIVRRAQTDGKPVRLVSSALNLDSFSLYTRLGFIPYSLFQDVSLAVPSNGLRGDRPKGVDRVRLAEPDEACRLANLEERLQGIRREQDYRFFLTGKAGGWRTWVYEDVSGKLHGVLARSTHPSHSMLGPGVAVDESVALALLWVALDDARGTTPVFLLPCAAAGLVKAVYRWGGRNVELHLAQTTGPIPVTSGISFPTFLPESG
ncbi:MAG TPA: GNAT family N-acetyltransferase [Opitutaceae bacterium]|nr:GNAT family N-acetyltransferase [Opitutaceae bacterium]